MFLLSFVLCPAVDCIIWRSHFKNFKTTGHMCFEERMGSNVVHFEQISFERSALALHFTLKREGVRNFGQG